MISADQVAVIVFFVACMFYALGYLNGRFFR